MTGNLGFQQSKSERLQVDELGYENHGPPVDLEEAPKNAIFLMMKRDVERTSKDADDATHFTKKNETCIEPTENEKI